MKQNLAKTKKLIDAQEIISQVSKSINNSLSKINVFEKKLDEIKNKINQNPDQDQEDIDLIANIDQVKDILQVIKENIRKLEDKIKVLKKDIDKIFKKEQDILDSGLVKPNLLTKNPNINNKKIELINTIKEQKELEKKKIKAIDSASENKNNEIDQEIATKQNEISRIKEDIDDKLDDLIKNLKKKKMNLKSLA